MNRNVVSKVRERGKCFLIGCACLFLFDERGRKRKRERERGKERERVNENECHLNPRASFFHFFLSVIH